MNAYIIITNNGSLEDGLFADAALERVPGGPSEVYAALERKLQQGFRLVSSPLPVNVPLIRSPVRSIIVESAGPDFGSYADEEGLRLAAGARTRTAMLGVQEAARTRADQEMIDRDQLSHAMRDLRELRASGAKDLS